MTAERLLTSRTSQANVVLDMKLSALELFVTFGGVGRAPKAPGTFGTLAAIPLAWLAALYFGKMGYLIFATALLFSSIIACEIYERKSHGQRHDAGHIVIDEVVGYLIAFVWLPLTWQSALGAFLFFRFFDIVKPYPISVLDEKVRGGLGVMVDDVAAGLAANIVLQAIASQTLLLGTYGVFR